MRLTDCIANSMAAACTLSRNHTFQMTPSAVVTIPPASVTARRSPTSCRKRRAALASRTTIPSRKEVRTMNRANWFQVSQEGAKALGALHHYTTTGTGLEPELIHLVFLRVSQLN